MSSPTTQAGKFLKDVGGFSGRSLVRANAPALPVVGGKAAGQTDLVNVMPPFGSNSISFPAIRGPVNKTDLADRVLVNDPRDLWYLSLPARLTPSQVLMIFRAALGGDLWQQWQLQKLMSDSWVMFRKCAHELRSAIAGTRFSVKAHCEPGKNPSARAKAKADTVSRAMAAWSPDPFSDEKGWHGFIYHLTDSVLSGVCLVELQWRLLDGEILPRACTWVHPRQFTFSNGGRIAVWNMNFQAMTSPDPDKFMVMQYLSDSGSALGMGLVRPLGWFWSAVVFNREWMIQFGQQYGAGFLKAFYPDGATNEELAKLESFCQEARNKGYILLRKDKEDVEYSPPANLSHENPHHRLCEIADEAAQELLLGQATTTKGNRQSGQGGMVSGSGEVQAGVKHERLEDIASQVSAGPLRQFAAAVCRVNYDGDDSECPDILPDSLDVPDPLAEAQRDQIFLAASVPMLASEFYAKHKLTQPNDGDVVVVGGKVGTMAGKDDPISAKGAGAQPTDEKGMPLPPEPTEPDETTVDKPEGEPQSRGAVQAMLARASDGELLGITKQLVLAMESPHHNGEVKAVKASVNRLLQK